MVCSLAVVVPVAFAAGLAARKPVPPMATLAGVATGVLSDFGPALWERDDLWPRHSIRARLFAGKTSAAPFAVGLSSSEPIARPDLVVYWVPGDRNLGDDLPDSAFLLGAFVNGAALPLPRQAAGGNGVLVLYSLADHEIVATSKAFAAAAASPGTVHAADPQTNESRRGIPAATPER
jgi:hypothetical protein